MTIEQRTPTIDDIGAERRDGGVQIAPGIWFDRAGGLHFSEPELLELFGWPDDAQHRAMMRSTLRQVCAANFPAAKIVEQD